MRASSHGKNGSLLLRRQSSNFSLRRIRMLASHRFPRSPPWCRFFLSFRRRREILRLARHLIKKSAWHRLLWLAPFSPREGERKRQIFSCPRHANVTKPPLLIDRRFILGHHRALVRQDPFFHTHQIH